MLATLRITRLDLCACSPWTMPQPCTSLKHCAFLPPQCNLQRTTAVAAPCFGQRQVENWPCSVMACFQPCGSLAMTVVLAVCGLLQGPELSFQQSKQQHSSMLQGSLKNVKYFKSIFSISELHILYHMCYITQMLYQNLRILCTIYKLYIYSCHYP